MKCTSCGADADASPWSHNTNLGEFSAAVFLASAKISVCELRARFSDDSRSVETAI
jgi:hypothetical protein